MIHAGGHGQVDLVLWLAYFTALRLFVYPSIQGMPGKASGTIGSVGPLALISMQTALLQTKKPSSKPRVFRCFALKHRK